MSDTERKKIVVYHADCPDGFGAAWAAWKKLGTSATYLGAHRETAPDPSLVGSDLYLVDFGYSPEIIRDLQSKGTRVTFIDHHATDKRLVEIADESLFDLNHSGAVLSWMFFHKGTPVPALLQHIEDFDIWKFELPNTKEIDHALSTYEMEFSIWDKLAQEIETEEGRDHLIRIGSILEAKVQKTVQRLADGAEEVEFEGHKVLMVNSPVHVSELGHELSKRRPPFGIVWSRRGKLIIVSMRGDGTIDTSTFAQKYGGGGHPSSSAFRWEEDQLLRFKKR